MGKLNNRLGLQTEMETRADKRTKGRRIKLPPFIDCCASVPVVLLFPHFLPLPFYFVGLKVHSTRSRRHGACTRAPAARGHARPEHHDQLARTPGRARARATECRQQARPRGTGSAPWRARRPAAVATALGGRNTCNMAGPPCPPPRAAAIPCTSRRASRTLPRTPLTHQ